MDLVAADLAIVAARVTGVHRRLHIHHKACSAARLAHAADALCAAGVRGALLLLTPAAIVFLVALIAGRPIVGLATAAPTAFAAIAPYGLLYGDITIAGWFCCMFLPLTRIYFNSTQCGYVAAPLIYLSVAPIFDCWDMLAAGKAAMPIRSAFNWPLAAVGLMAFCDNAVSVPNAWIAYQKTGQFNDNVVNLLPARPASGA